MFGNVVVTQSMGTKESGAGVGTGACSSSCTRDPKGGSHAEPGMATDSVRACRDMATGGWEGARSAPVG